MTEMKKYAPGQFCWTDLMTSDVTAAKQFYGEVLGWSFDDVPAGPGMTYSMCTVGGKQVCAMAPLMEQERKMNIPPHWNNYVSVEGADAAQKKAESLGGKIVAPAFDVMDVGRMAVLQDPAGAYVSVWQPKKHAGAALIGEPRTMVWNECMTTDVAKAEKFYTQLFGWTTKPMPELKYTMFLSGAEMRGGLMQIEASMKHVPPHWMVHFGVTDVDGTVNRAKQMKGNVHVPGTDIPNVGRFAVLADPQGASFGIFKSNPK